MKATSNFKPKVVSSVKIPPHAREARAAAVYGTGMKGFFAWMRANDPRLYSAALPAMNNPGISGLGDDLTAPTSAGPASMSTADKWKDLLSSLASAYLTKEQLDMQKKVLTAQLQRAQAGLPPLDINMAAYGAVPTANVGISPETQKLLLWGAAALAAVYLIPKFLRR